MPTPLIDLLRSLDDPLHLEYPPGFQSAVEQTRFVQLVAALQASFGCRCWHEAGLQVQDASYLGALVVPASATELGTDIHIRISNFGGLALVCPERPGCYDDDEARLLISSDDRERIESALQQSGYISIPEDLLWMRYDNPPVEAAREQMPPSLVGTPWRPVCWFDRFFDYL